MHTLACTVLLAMKNLLLQRPYASSNQHHLGDQKASQTVLRFIGGPRVLMLLPADVQVDETCQPGVWEL